MDLELEPAKLASSPGDGVLLATSVLSQPPSLTSWLSKWRGTGRAHLPGVPCADTLPQDSEGMCAGKTDDQAKGAGDWTGGVPAGPAHLFCIQTYEAYNYCDYSYKPHIESLFMGHLG